MSRNTNSGVFLANQPQKTGVGTASSELTNLISGLMDDTGDPQEPPKQEPPKQEPPKQEPSGQEPPKQEPPKQEPPKQEPPKQEPPPPELIPPDVLGGQPTDSGTTPPPPVEEGFGETEEPAPLSVQQDEKANKAWQKLKQERRELRDKVKAQEARLAKMSEQQADGDVEEVARLRAAVRDYETKLAKYDLAETQAFKDRFDKPMTSVAQRGVAAAVRFGKSPEEAQELMKKLLTGSKTPEDLSDMLASEPYSLQGALVNLAAEFDELSQARNAALKDWEQTQAALKSETKRESAVKLMEDVERDTEAALQQVQKAGNWMYTRSEQSPEWNAQVDQRIKAVKGILRSGKPQDIITLIMEGATAMDTRALAASLNDQVKDLQARVQGLVKRSPSFGEGGNPPAQGGEMPSKPRAPAEFLEEVFGDSPGLSLRR